MGYANPIEAMGYEKFAARAKACGIDGVLTVDYPPEESEEWVKYLERQQIDAIFLLPHYSASARRARSKNGEGVRILRFSKRSHWRT